MIIVSNKNGNVLAYFDKNTSENANSYQLNINSKTTNDSYNWEGLVNISLLNSYYEFSMSFSGVTNGEYEYKLSYVEDNTPKVVDMGLILVEDKQGLEHKSYSNSRVFKSYNPLKQ